MNPSTESFIPPKPVLLPHRKREKPQLSCTLCRKRKLKCDRGNPCDTCVKRGLSLSCTYVYSYSNKTSKLSVADQPQILTHVKLEDRIAQLENLVATQLKGLGKGGGKTGYKVDSPSSRFNVREGQEYSPPASSSDKGRISVTHDRTTWVESDHWSAILDGISELKDSLEPGNARDKGLDTSEVPGPDLLLGEQHQVKKHDILAALPPRPAADRLVSQFIKSVEIAPMVVHIPTFLKEYEHFWDHQEQTPVMWIGLLFGIICLAALHHHSGFEPVNDSSRTAQDSTDVGRLAQCYRSKIAQCLIFGNYTKPSRYSVETLLLYLHVEYVRSQDAQTGLWILLGIIIRLALRMGYHRDGADFFPQISPFHAEIRRRVWCVIVMMDAGAAAQFGLPRMVQARQCNTSDPRSLLDEDIREDMTELPHARPESTLTIVQYFVAKNRLISEFGQIAELKTLTKPPEYIDILRLDGKLQSIYDNTPPSLMMRPMSMTILDSPSQIIHRIYIALIFLRSKCTLHHTYLIPSWTNQVYKYSRTACIEAALEILQIQQTLDQETRAGGRLYEDRGKASSVVRSDFLLATTILCVDIDYAVTKVSTRAPNMKESDRAPDDKVIAALRNAHQTWLRSSSSSREAQQAARAIDIVLAKASPGTDTPSSTVLDRATLGSVSDTNESHSFDDMLIAVNPTLYAGLQGDAVDFPGMSGLDFEMGEPGEYEIPSSAKAFDTNGDDSEFAWAFSNDTLGEGH